MANKQERPKEAFERLRQSFDVIKANHSDAWSWHQYLEGDKPVVAEPEAEDEGDDPEMFSLKPKPRKTVDRLKSHLLACVAELTRASQAADLCFYHMCAEPAEMRPCCVVLGTSGDVDEELLNAAGDGSPEKIMAALQEKLDKAHSRIAELEHELTDLRDRLTDTKTESQDRWNNWQRSRMEAEEAMTRLDTTTKGLNAALEREAQLEEAYDDLYMRMVRASRLMIYKGREMLRDKIFKSNKKEQVFYSFHGFISVLKAEKEERLRREHEQQRDGVEFALGNEVRFLLAELSRSNDAVGRITTEASRLKRQRRELARARAPAVVSDQQHPQLRRERARTESSRLQLVVGLVLVLAGVVTAAAAAGAVVLGDDRGADALHLLVLLLDLLRIRLGVGVEPGLAVLESVHDLLLLLGVHLLAQALVLS